MSRRKAKSWLRRAGILELHGGRWVVSESRLRERLPDVYDRVFAFFVLGDQSDTKRQEPTQR